MGGKRIPLEEWKEHRKEYMKEWADRSEVAERRWSQRIQRTYGVGPEDFYKILDSQCGRCAICGEITALSIDHCHVTGRVRGLLCLKCNNAIGLLCESQKIIRNAGKYLRKKTTNNPVIQYQLFPLP